MSSTNPFSQPISNQIWREKYRLVTQREDVPDDETVQDTWMRIAKACANSQPELYGHDHTMDLPDTVIASRTREFYSALEDFKFLPAGRITAGAGSGRNVTLFNCYVMGTIPDSMAGIFDMLKEAALTMQQGGGIGYDFSTLRPKGAPVKGVDADASGPLTFMDVWDAMCRTVMSAGSRRGAMMATMRCDHPDIEDFITAKRDPLRLRMFNLSVLVTDAFMNAVKSDADWNLHFTNRHGERRVYKTVRARDLWEKIMDNTYNFAEPGVIFIDRINAMNNLWYAETIAATNPCGEQPLPPYGACLLGSVNLTKVVINAFTKDAYIDWNLLEKVTKQAVEILDAVIDISLFPIPQQLAEAKAKRRMGIGITGLADALLMMGLTYGSDEAASLLDTIMMTMTCAAYRQSIELAKLYGPCPVTMTLEQRQKYVSGRFIRGLPDDIQDGIIQHGIRNSHLMSIAPTGTISLYAGNISSGIEPIFAPAYTRKVLNPDGTKRQEKVEDYAVRLYRELINFDDDAPIPCLVTAQDLPASAHLKMQATAQKWVDSSISKTINLPEEISFEDFKEVYMVAYESGCKGCTTYRPNDVTGSIISTTSEKDKAKEEVVKPQSVQPLKRPDILRGNTYKAKWQGNNVYITINDYDDQGKTIPFEIFINSKEVGHFQWTTGLMRMISAIFRRGGDINFVIDELKQTFDPNGGAFYESKYVPSMVALLGIILEKHLRGIDYNGDLPPMELKIEGQKLDIPTLAPELSVKPAQCPQCKDFSLVANSGCPTCTSCGYSKCG